MAYKRRAIKDISNAVSIMIKPLLAGPEINNQRKKIPEEIPKPNPTARQPLSKRQERPVL